MPTLGAVLTSSMDPAVAVFSIVGSRTRQASRATGSLQGKCRSAGCLRGQRPKGLYLTCTVRVLDALVYVQRTARRDYPDGRRGPPRCVALSR